MEEVVVVYRGNIADEDLRQKLGQLTDCLSSAVKSQFEMIDVKEWNSVKVTFKTRKEAIAKLKMMASTNQAQLAELGILSLQIDNEEEIDLRTSHANRIIGNQQVVAGSQIQIRSATDAVQQSNQRKRVRKRSKDSKQPVKMPKKQDQVLAIPPPQQQHYPSTAVTTDINSVRSNNSVSDDSIFSIPQTPQQPPVMSPTVEQLMSEYCPQQGNPEDDLMSVQLQSFNSGQNLPASSDMLELFPQIIQEGFDFDINPGNSGGSAGGGTGGMMNNKVVLTSGGISRDQSTVNMTGTTDHSFRSLQQPSGNSQYMTDGSGMHPNFGQSGVGAIPDYKKQQGYLGQTGAGLSGPPGHNQNDQAKLTNSQQTVGIIRQGPPQQTPGNIQNINDGQRVNWNSPQSDAAKQFQHHPVNSSNSNFIINQQQQQQMGTSDGMNTICRSHIPPQMFADNGTNHSQVAFNNPAMKQQNVQSIPKSGTPQQQQQQQQQQASVVSPLLVDLLRHDNEGVTQVGSVLPTMTIASPGPNQANKPKRRRTVRKKKPPKGAVAGTPTLPEGIFHPQGNQPQVMKSFQTLQHNFQPQQQGQQQFVHTVYQTQQQAPMLLTNNPQQQQPGQTRMLTPQPPRTPMTPTTPITPGDDNVFKTNIEMKQGSMMMPQQQPDLTQQNYSMPLQQQQAMGQADVIQQQQIRPPSNSMYEHYGQQQQQQQSSVHMASSTGDAMQQQQQQQSFQSSHFGQQQQVHVGVAKSNLVKNQHIPNLNNNNSKLGQSLRIGDEPKKHDVYALLGAAKRSNTIGSCAYKAAKSPRSSTFSNGKLTITRKTICEPWAKSHDAKNVLDDQVEEVKKQVKSFQAQSEQKLKQQQMLQTKILQQQKQKAKQQQLASVLEQQKQQQQAQQQHTMPQVHVYQKPKDSPQPIYQAQQQQAHRLQQQSAQQSLQYTQQQQQQMQQRLLQQGGMPQQQLVHTGPQPAMKQTLQQQIPPQHLQTIIQQTPQHYQQHKQLQQKQQMPPQAMLQRQQQHHQIQYQQQRQHVMIKQQMQQGQQQNASGQQQQRPNSRQSYMPAQSPMADRMSGSPSPNLSMQQSPQLALSYTQSRSPMPHMTSKNNNAMRPQQQALARPNEMKQRVVPNMNKMAASFPSSSNQPSPQGIMQQPNLAFTHHSAAGMNMQQQNWHPSYSMNQFQRGPMKNFQSNPVASPAPYFNKQAHIPAQQQQQQHQQQHHQQHQQQIQQQQAVANTTPQQYTDSSSGQGTPGSNVYHQQSPTSSNVPPNNASRTAHMTG